MKKEIIIFGVLILICILGLSVISEVHADGLIGIGTKGKEKNDNSVGSNSVGIAPSIKNSNSNYKPIEIDPRQRPDEICIRNSPKLTVYFHNQTIGLYDNTPVDVFVQNKDSYSCLASEFSISMSSNHLETPRTVSYSLMPEETIRVRMEVASGNLAGNFFINSWAQRDTYPSAYNLSNITVLPNSPNDIIITPFYAELQFNNYRNFDVFGYDEYSNYITFEDGEINWSSDIGYIYQNGTFYANETGEGFIFASYGNITGNASVRVFEDPCHHENPSIILYPLEDVISIPEQEVILTAQITNNDNIDCVQTLFDIVPEINNWVIIDYPENVFLNSGETKNITFILNAPSVLGTELFKLNISNYFNNSFYATAEKNLTTLRASPTNIQLIPENDWVPAGLEMQYEVIITDAFGNYYNPYEEGTLTWETNAGTIENGLLMPLYAGEKYVNATYELDEVIIEGTANLEVKPTRLIRIEITPNEEVGIEVNNIIDFNATGYDEYNNTIDITPIWNTTAGEINEDGTLNATTVGTHDVYAEFTYKALVPGRARISHNANDSVNEDIETPEGFHFEEITIIGDTEIRVTPGPSVDFTISPSDIEMFVGKTQIINATGYDEFGNPFPISVNWSIGDSPERISLRDSYGTNTRVTALSAGNARVDAEYMGVNRYAHVHVSWSYPDITLISPNNILLNTGEDIIFNITDTDGIDFATYNINSGPTIHISPLELPIYIIDTDTLESGHNELEIYAKDVYNSQITENYNILITELPVINLTSHISGDTINVGEILVFNMSDEYFTFTYKWNDELEQEFTDRYNLTVPALYDENNLTIYARDTEGLGLILNETYVFNLQQAPIIILESPLEGTRVLGGEIINLTIIDPDGFITNSYYSWNGGYNIVFTDPYDITVDPLFLNSDENILTIYAKDNEELETEINYTFLGENTLPEIAVDPVNGSIITEGDNITVYMIDRTGLQTLTYECPIEGLKAVNLEGNLTANHTLNCTWINGENNLEIIVYDIAGGNATINYTIYYDISGPIITLVSPLAGSNINEGDILVFDIIDLNGIENAGYYWDNADTEFDCDPTNIIATIDINGTEISLTSEDETYTFGEVNFTIVGWNSGTYTYIDETCEYWGSTNIDLRVASSSDSFDFDNQEEGTSFSFYDLDITIENLEVEFDIVPVPIFDLFDTNYNITVPDLSYGIHNVTIYAVDSLGYESNATFVFEHLIGEGSLSGRVWSYTGGEALANAFIQVVDHPEWNATTDAFGNYVILDIDEGVYNIQASKTGYSIQTVYGIGINAGSETTGINFYLSEYGAISGTVTDWFGNPIENANVTIYEARTTRILGWTLTDISGDYELNELSVGFYDVEASADGYISSKITDRPVIAGETTIVNLLLD
jgi:hypothetical protein